MKLHKHYTIFKKANPILNNIHVVQTIILTYYMYTVIKTNVAFRSENNYKHILIYRKLSISNFNR